MEVKKGKVKVAWVNLNEGESGDYDPTDPNDTNYLRFDVLIRSASRRWIEVSDASYCTLVPASTCPGVQARLLWQILDEVHDPLMAGHSIKKMCERLSWIEPSWDKGPIKVSA